MNERELKQHCRQLAEAMGWVYYPGTGRNGAPDQLYMKSGRGFTVEAKIGNNKQDPDQVIEETYITTRDVPYYLVRTLEEFRIVILNEEGKLNENI